MFKQAVNLFLFVRTDFEKVIFWKIRSNFTIYDWFTMIPFAREPLEVTWDIRECWGMIFDLRIRVDEIKSWKIGKKGPKSMYVGFWDLLSKENRRKKFQKIDFFNFFLFSKKSMNLLSDTSEHLFGSFNVL